MSESGKPKPFVPGIPGALVSLDGELRFVPEEKERLRRYFTSAGIDVDQVRTVGQYRLARSAASPGFMDWLAAEIERKPMTPERRKLIEILRKPVDSPTSG